METLLISLHPRHSQNIFAGKKTIELIMRLPRVKEFCYINRSYPPSFGKILIYETLPTASIVGFCDPIDITVLTSEQWIQQKSDFCLEVEEIRNYLGDRMGYGIRIRNPKRITPIPLLMMRELGILPPQGYRYLNDEMIEKLGVKFNE